MLWLKEVNKLNAYFKVVSQRGRRDDPIESGNDYFAACKEIRDLLVKRGIKAKPEEFGTAKAYLESHYLTQDVSGLFKIDHDKNTGAKKLICTKVDRIGKTTGEKDDRKNRANAETYVKMFYELIIPAVMQNDEESVLTVLKAFQFSKAPDNCYFDH